MVFADEGEEEADGEFGDGVGGVGGDVDGGYGVAFGGGEVDVIGSCALGVVRMVSLICDVWLLIDLGGGGSHAGQLSGLPSLLKLLGPVDHR